jgi:hypothetical protein
MNDPLKFQPNTPLELRLAYGSGKLLSTPFGRRVMFTVVGNRVMFLDITTAEKITRLGVKPRQPFFLCRHHSGLKGALDHWRAWLPGQPVPPPPDGAFAPLFDLPQEASHVA